MIADGFWTSLRYLAVTRLLIAGILILVLPTYTKRFETNLLQNLPMFLTVAGVYVLFAITALVLIGRIRLKLHHQLAIHVAADLVFLSLLVFASGGAKTGFGLLMMAPVAGTAILVTPVWALFTAAIASVSLLGQSLLLFVRDDTIEPGFFAAAATGATLFAVAFILNRLAARAAANEARAVRRGNDLRNQLLVNQMVIAELADGVLIFNGSGRVRVMNRAAQQLLGSAPAQELAQNMGSTLMGFLPTGKGWNIVADQLRIWQDLGAPNSHVVEVALSSGVTIDSGKNGDQKNVKTWPQTQRVSLRFLSSPRLSDNSAGQDFVLVIEDLERVEQQAQQLKLASMGRLSASIAHEVRNPLGAIRHANGLLAESLGAEAPSSQVRLTRIVEDNTVRINRIVEDILAISRRERAQLEPIDLAMFFADFLPEFVIQQGCDSARIELDLRSDESMYFDPAHLHQILVNLLVNALRYSAEGSGSIRLVWQKVTERNAFEFIVADNGPGVPKALMGSLFEPFATTDSKGTGLGLYLAREMCGFNHAVLRYEAQASRVLLTTGADIDAGGRPVDWSGYGAFIISSAMS